MTAQCIEQQNCYMREYQEGGPEDGRPHRKMIVHIACGSVFLRPELLTCLNSRSQQQFVGMAPVFFKAQIALNQQGARVSVISDSFAVHSRIDDRQRK